MKWKKGEIQGMSEINGTSGWYVKIYVMMMMNTTNRLCGDWVEMNGRRRRNNEEEREQLLEMMEQYNNEMKEERKIVKHKMKQSVSVK